MAGSRSFKVVQAKKGNGCVTKHDPNSRYRNNSPGGAARKAAHALCLRKKIRGVCTLYVTIQETTRGSSNKKYTYMCKRAKLNPPKEIKDKDGNVIYTVEYTMHCKAVKGAVPLRKGAKCKQTVGIMAKKTKLQRRRQDGGEQEGRKEYKLVKRVNKALMKKLKEEMKKGEKFIDEQKRIKKLKEDKKEKSLNK